MAKAVEPVEPEAPDECPTAEPGEVNEEETGEEEEEEEQTAEEEEEQTSWIEIKLVDEANEPVAGAPFKLKLANGKFRRGSTDENGFCRIERIPPGSCEVTFTSLDKEAWEKK